MPRPKPPRGMEAERNVAARVAYERERARYSYAGLAQRMTDLGCAIDASAIYKIEKSDPPRRITVDELVGFAAVFGLEVDELLVPPVKVVGSEVAELLDKHQALTDEIQRLELERAGLGTRIFQLLATRQTAELVASMDLWPAIRDVFYAGRPDLELGMAETFHDLSKRAPEQQKGKRSGKRRKKA